MKTNKIIKFVFPALVLVLTSAYFSCDNPTGPIEEQPGRRDYVWTVDTLDMPMNYLSTVWGSSPNDVWAGGAGGTEYDRLWHYDGNKWKVYNKGPIYCTLNTLYGFSSNNVWMGGGDGRIWHYDGNRWSQNFRVKVDGSYSISVDNMWGNSSNDIYACGTIFYNMGSVYDTLKLKGFVLHYDGSIWKEIVKGPEGFQFLYIKGEAFIRFISGSGNVYVYAYNVSKTGDDSVAFYELNGSNLKKIYSNSLGKISGANFALISGKLFFLIGSDVYRYVEEDFIKQFSVSNINFGYYIFGRTSKDIFINMNDGLAHFNGDNIQYILKYPSNWNIISGQVLFENELFSGFVDSDNNRNLVLIGKLKK